MLGVRSLWWRTRNHPALRGARRGRPARPLEPYMGMLSHAAINRDDGTVFVHLHPMGTLNMAAQQVFMNVAMDARAARWRGWRGWIIPRIRQGAWSPFRTSSPQPGRYRVWVQVKSAGKVLTGVFTASVAPRPAS